MTARKGLIAILVAGIIVLAVAVAPQFVSIAGAPSTARDPDAPDGMPPQAVDVKGDHVASPAQNGQGISGVTSLDDLPRLGPELTISALDNTQHSPAIAYNWKHNEFLVLWHNSWGGSRDIYAQRVKETGELKSWFDVTVNLDKSKDRAQPSVAYDPVNDQYLVVWIYDKKGDGSDWDLRGRMVPWDGLNLSPEITICDWGTQQWTPKVVYADTAKEFLVVWQTWYQTSVLPDYISGRVVLPLGGFGNNFDIYHATEHRHNPDVSYNHARNEYLVVYDNDADILATRFNALIQALGGGEFGIATWPDQETVPAVAACAAADQYLVLWQSLRSGEHDLFAYLIKGDGTLQSVHTISDLAGHQQVGDVACDVRGRRYMLAWQEQDASGNAGISGRLVSPDGTLHRGFQIVPPGLALGHDEPAVAGGYVRYLVTWEHVRGVTIYRDIHGRMIAPVAAFLPIVLR